MTILHVAAYGNNRNKKGQIPKWKSPKNHITAGPSPIPVSGLAARLFLSLKLYTKNENIRIYFLFYSTCEGP